MTNFQKMKAHFKTITKHRKIVRKMCFKMGIPLQGLVHDLSKYSKKEFAIYKFYDDGSCSPHQRSREAIGYSGSWLYHKNKNKHHWEFWLDNQDDIDWVAVKIPYKYVIEMFCDMLAANKIYTSAVREWRCSDPLQYWETKCKGIRLMHPASAYLIEKLFTNLSAFGEKEFIRWYKDNKKYIKCCYNSSVDIHY